MSSLTLSVVVCHPLHYEWGGVSSVTLWIWHWVIADNIECGSVIADTVCGTGSVPSLTLCVVVCHRWHCVVPVVCHPWHWVWWCVIADTVWYRLCAIPDTECGVSSLTLCVVLVVCHPWHWVRWCVITNTMRVVVCHYLLWDWQHYECGSDTMSVAVCHCWNMSVVECPWWNCEGGCVASPGLWGW